MKKSDKPIPSHINDFLDWLDIEKGLSSKSQENYGRFIKKFVDWLKLKKLSSLKPHDLTPEHIWDYKVFLSRHSPIAGGQRGQTLKKSTQNYYLISLRSLLNYFADRDILSLPSEKIKLARDKGERPVRFLSIEQLRQLFSVMEAKTIQGLRDRAIVESLFSTGMRISELTALNRDQIKIRPGLKELELVITGKGGRVRTVYFSQRSLEWLGRYLDARTDTQKALFVNHNRKNGSFSRLTPRSIERNIKRCAILAGLPLTTTPHVFRHTFATDLLNQGVDLRVIQEFLGHKDIGATQIYTKVTSKKLREIHQRFHSGAKLP